MIAFGMPNGMEWLVIMVIVLIFFGPGRLPEVFKRAGEGIRAFKDASEGKPEATAKQPPPAQATEAEDEYEEVVVRRKKRPKQLAADELDDVEEPERASAKRRA